jgi:L-lactate utilization protein LutB
MDETRKFILARYNKLGPKVVQAFKTRFFDAWYFPESAKAREHVLSLIPKGDVISWGGSFTVEVLGIKELARERGYEVIDRDSAKSPEERVQLMKKALTCDTFLTSSNAISEDGQLVNIDGGGNRVAAMIYGPRQVIVVAGMNKVAKTLEDAVVRARTIASPINHQRFGNLATPCNETGTCHDCKSADSFCTYIVTTRMCKPAGRIKVVLIGEDFGF